MIWKFETQHFIRINNNYGLPSIHNLKKRKTENEKKKNNLVLIFPRQPEYNIFKLFTNIYVMYIIELNVKN